MHWTKSRSTAVTSSASVAIAVTKSESVTPPILLKKISFLFCFVSAPTTDSPPTITKESKKPIELFFQNQMTANNEKYE